MGKQMSHKQLTPLDETKTTFLTQLTQVLFFNKQTPFLCNNMLHVLVFIPKRKEKLYMSFQFQYGSKISHITTVHLCILLFLL